MTAIGLRSCIVTNGTLLDHDIAAQLLAAGMRTISVSIDGLQNEHEQMRAKEPGRAPCPRSPPHARHRCRRRSDHLRSPCKPRLAPFIERAVRDAGRNALASDHLDRMGRLAGGPDPNLWLDPTQVCRCSTSSSNEGASFSRPATLWCAVFLRRFLGVRRELRVRPAMVSACRTVRCFHSERRQRKRLPVAAAQLGPRLCAH